MTENSERQPKGIPSGGQFAATSHTEPEVSLAPAPEKKNQDWHDAADDLIAGGRTPEAARGAVATLLSMQMAKQYLTNTQTHLAASRDTDAALHTIAFSSIKDLPSKLNAANNDPKKMREALADSRGSLRRTGSMLDNFHPTGRQPVFKLADDVMSELDEFLATDSEAAGN